jgi:hypothetical protein
LRNRNILTDEIVRIVTALKKNANQRLVVGGVRLRDGGVHESQITDGRSHRRRANGSASGAPDEIPSRDDRNAFFVHKIISG